eukprot:TRINITY_DN5328_c0_g1_i1.p1 TRINITY_DN5328_c0_g1~~TRINITY_DN5328_c0_g1_i1.p1  ORF type:complete len:478 (+),score=69.16 TRINITY_DN5328_c0_g1_i1:74-1507(+)
MIDIFLTIITAVVFIVIWLASTYLMIHFQHPYETNTAVFPKIMIVLGLSLATGNVLLLPLDVAQRNSQYGGLPMYYIWLAIYVMIALVGVIGLPAANFYYDGEDSDKKGAGCACAAKGTVLVFLIFAAVVAVGYIFLGVSEVPYTDITIPESFLVSGDKISDQPLTNLNAGIPVSTAESILTIKISIITFLIAGISVFGWVLLVIFGGIGFIALPVDLINSFRERPREIKKETYTDRKIKIGERAEELLKEGLKYKTGKGDHKEKNNWKKQVYLLDKEYSYNEIAYWRKGGPLVVYIFKLIFGIICICMSIMWIVQLVIWTNLRIYPLLNYMLTAMDGIWGFFGCLFFTLFAYYLLLCVFKGNFKFGVRIPFLISLHPMEENNTLIGSMLVNVNLILVSSVAATHLCAETFSEYARSTTINTIFNVAIKYLRGLYWFWYVVHWVLIGIAGLSIFYFIFRPTDRDTKIYMKAQKSVRR